MNRFPCDQTYRHFMTTGCDEVGRGCMAGPVVTAALSWTPDQVMTRPFYSKLRDSKETSEKTRLTLYRDILTHASRIRVDVISHMVVDRINVLRASLLGFERTAPEYREGNYLFIDGNQKPARLKWAKTLVKGENRLSAIAGASIVAKVIRDEIMTSLAKAYPEYDFQSHVGYPTQAHKKALSDHGPCPIHRKSYKPLAPFVSEQASHSPFIQNLLRETDPAAIQNAWRNYSQHYFEFSPAEDRMLYPFFLRHGYL
ncbi:MAG: ribonuclease HII [Acidobacteria bacterium]|nr:MAG: ribonuclease HII [Acidobacteriota bacterium]